MDDSKVETLQHQTDSVRRLKTIPRHGERLVERVEGGVQTPCAEIVPEFNVGQCIHESPSPNEARIPVRLDSNFWPALEVHRAQRSWSLAGCCSSADTGHQIELQRNEGLPLSESFDAALVCGGRIATRQAL